MPSSRATEKKTLGVIARVLEFGGETRLGKNARRPERREPREEGNRRRAKEPVTCHLLLPRAREKSERK